MRIVPKRTDLLYPDLSYKIVGVLFSVFNECGPGQLEKTYQKAIEQIFVERGIAFQPQVAVPLKFRKEIIGKYVVDFLVNDAIVVELKRGSRMQPSHIRQVLAYLQSLNLPLGIIAYFHSDGVSFRRIVNHSYIRTDS